MISLNKLLYFLFYWDIVIVIAFTVVQKSKWLGICNSVYSLWCRLEVFFLSTYVIIFENWKFITTFHANGRYAFFKQKSRWENFNVVKSISIFLFQKEKKTVTHLWLPRSLAFRLWVPGEPCNPNYWENRFKLKNSFQVLPHYTWNQCYHWSWWHGGPPAFKVHCYLLWY